MTGSQRAESNSTSRNPETEAAIGKLHDWIDAHSDELIAHTQDLLRIDSVESEAAPNAPFGAGNRQALDLALSWANKAGMKTTDLEGYFGYADFGQGERLVMTIGHLDVVPVGNGWTKEPFGAKLEEGYIYARGATDDKGPTVASFFALRAIQESFPELNCRFRAGFGCDEESGFLCIERYVQTEETPAFGVAPDSGWPCYNAEKGICDLLIKMTTPQSAVRLVYLRGGSRPNIVIDEATAEIEIDPSVRAEVERKVSGWFDRNLTCTWEGETLLVSALGKAAHGSMPFLGDNAVTKIFRLLLAIVPISEQGFYETLLETGHPGGEGLGIHGMDPTTGLLSCNMGIADAKNGELQLLFNIRYNVDTTAESLQERASAKLNSVGATVEIERDSRPLFFPVDHPLVRTVVQAYADETGEHKEPGSMGGGTYARAIPNSVSIGTSWPGDGDAHGPDERVATSTLIRAAKIYARILYGLATVSTEGADSSR